MTVAPQFRAGPSHPYVAKDKASPLRGVQPTNMPRCPSGQWVLLCALSGPAVAAAGAGPLFGSSTTAPQSDRAPHAEPSPTAAQKHRNRAGRVALGLRLEADVYEQLRDMAFYENLPMQALLEEGVALLFQSRRQK